jgi:hypothetical protein
MATDVELAECQHCGRTSLLLIENAETNSPQGESDAMRCLPAGCGERPECERLLDRQLLSKFKMRVSNDFKDWREMLRQGSLTEESLHYAEKMIIQYAKVLTRAEGQDGL